jgi:hypothetical protein
MGKGVPDGILAGLCVAHAVSIKATLKMDKIFIDVPFKR